MKRSDKNLDDTKSTRNKDYDANEALKTIREIRNENCDEEKNSKRFVFYIWSKKGHHYEPKETVNAVNNTQIKYERMREKYKTLTIKEYLNVTRPYLSDIANNHRAQEEWKIYSGNIVTDYKT